MSQRLYEKLLITALIWGYYHIHISCKQFSLSVSSVNQCGDVMYVKISKNGQVMHTHLSTALAEC